MDLQGMKDSAELGLGIAMGAGLLAGLFALVILAAG